MPTAAPASAAAAPLLTPQVQVVAVKKMIHVNEDMKARFLKVRLLCCAVLGAHSRRSMRSLHGMPRHVR